jgi:hypothetical protein
MGGVHIALAVEESTGRGGGGGQGVGAGRVGVVGVVQQCAHVAEIAGDVGAQAGRLRQPTGLVRAGAAQLRGAQQGGDGADGVTAAQGAVGHLVQQGGDLVVGADGRVGEVPGPVLGALGEFGGERQLRPPAFLAGRQIQHRGTGQRMPELQPAGDTVDLDEPGPLGGGQPGETVRSAQRPLEDVQFTRAVQHGEQQQLPGGGRERADPGGEDALEALGQRQHGRQGAALRLLQVVEGDGQFEQRQGVAPGLRDQPPAHPGRHRREPLGHQLVRRDVVQGLDLVLRYPDVAQEGLVAGPGRAQQSEGFGVQGAGDGPQDRGAGPVHPRHVVDDQRERTGLRGGPGQQGVHGVRDGEQFGRLLLGQPADRLEGLRLPCGQRGNPLGQRLQQLVQRREADALLERAAGDPQHPEAGLGRAQRRGVQQRGLAHPGLSGQHQRGSPREAVSKCRSRTASSADRPMRTGGVRDADAMTSPVVVEQEQELSRAMYAERRRT